MRLCRELAHNLIMSLDMTLARVEDDLARGDLSMARQRLRSLVDAFPQRLYLRVRLADVYRAMGEPTQAGRWRYLSPPRDETDQAEIDGFVRAHDRRAGAMAGEIGYRGRVDQVADDYARARLQELRSQALRQDGVWRSMTSTVSCTYGCRPGSGSSGVSWRWRSDCSSPVCWGRPSGVCTGGDGFLFTSGPTKGTACGRFSAPRQAAIRPDHQTFCSVQLPQRWPHWSHPEGRRVLVDCVDEEGQRRVRAGGGCVPEHDCGAVDLGPSLWMILWRRGDSNSQPPPCKGHPTSPCVTCGRPPRTGW
jgi:hypothetical protein